MSNKRYTEEFKIEAVRQVIDRGYSVAESFGGWGIMAAIEDQSDVKIRP